MDPKFSRHLAIAIAAFSLAMGLLHLYSIREAPQFKVPVLDEAAYDAQARGIIDGTWPDDKVFYQDPLYPYFLAFIYRLGGRGFVVVKIIQVLLGTISIFLVYWIGRMVFNPATGVVAALLVALYRPLYFFEGVMTKEILCLVLVCASFYFLLWTRRNKKTWGWLVSGLFLGAAILARANLLLLVPGWALWILFSKCDGFPFGRRLVLAGLFMLGTVLAISPATIHNIRAGDFVLVTSQGGQNFFIGNNPDNTSGTYKPPPFVRSHPFFEEADFRAYVNRRTRRDMKPSELSSFYYRLTWSLIRENPAAFIRALYRKALLVMNDYEISDNINYYFFMERYSPVLRLPTPGWGILFALALFGGIMIVHARRQNQSSYKPGYTPLFIFAVLYSATLVAFYVFARYRLPLIAVVPPLAAHGVLILLGYVRRFELGKLTAGLLVVAVAAIVTHKNLIEPRFDVAHYQTGNCLMKLGRLEEAEMEFREALLIDPTRPVYLVNHGAVLLELKKYRQALEDFQLAVTVAPRDGKARIGLGNAYFELGEHDEAALQYQMGILYGENTSLAWMLMARAYDKMHATNIALQALKKSLELDPGNEEALTLYEDIMEREQPPSVDELPPPFEINKLRELPRPGNFTEEWPD